jgi:hypothetical protein
MLSRRPERLKATRPVTERVAQKSCGEKTRNKTTTNNKRSAQMRSKRLLMGAAYGRDRRGERGLYASAGAEGGYRGDRAAYRDRAVGVGVGAVAADYTYPRRLYAYAPTYDVGYAAEPYYSYSPGYEAAVPTGPYYEPDWNVAYAGPSYAYAPGISFGIGIGPVGIGVGPAWGW